MAPSFDLPNVDSGRQSPLSTRTRQLKHLNCWHRKDLNPPAAGGLPDFTVCTWRISSNKYIVKS